jgi:fatty-acyl-CoA synthase
MLEGQTMEYPLTLTHYVERAGRYFPKAKVTWRRPDKSLAHYTFEKLSARSAQLAHALERLGVREGDRVATFCWNHQAHLEAFQLPPKDLYRDALDDLHRRLGDTASLSRRI